LEMITEGFMEMNHYPKAIILLAQRKTEDILSYIHQLAEIKEEQVEVEIAASDETEIVSQSSEVLLQPAVDDEIEDIENESLELNFNEIDSSLQIEVQKDMLSDEINVESVDNDAEPLIEDVADLGSITETKKIVEPLEWTISEPRKTVLNDREISPTRNQILATPDNSISSTLANKKISDIKQAISIGERFRFQRELFRGNGEDMNKTLTYINQLATLDEVMAFLQSKYNWAEDNETAAIFFQIVKRRF